MAAPKCPCCGDDLSVNPTTTGRPYLRCDPCRVQTFVRGEKGVDRFNAKYGTDWQDKKTVKPPAPPTEPAAPPAKKPAAAKKGSDDIMDFDDEDGDD
jgi:hypothetical protein